MSRATPLMRDFAERLIAYETSGTKSSGTKTPAAFHICEKLRPPLATLMGNTGFRALLARAFALAEAEAPRLRTVQIQADGSLAESEEPGSPEEAEKLAEGGVVLLAQLFGLLEVFIGQNLTQRMLHEVWPKLSLSDSYFDKEDQK